MNSFLWWSGVAFWGCLSAASTIAFVDMAIERLLRSLGVYQDVLAFAIERKKQRTKIEIDEDDGVN